MKKTVSYALLLVITVPALASAQATDDSMFGRRKSSTTETVDLDRTCLRTSLQVREDALSGALSSFTQSQQSIMASRESALLAAIALPTARERADARKLAWNTFRTASRENHNTLRTKKTQIWSTFRASTLSCRGGSGELKYDQSSNSGSPTENL